VTLRARWVTLRARGVTVAQTARAAAFVSGFTKWSRMVLAGELSQDKDMCSNTFPKHFSSAKVCLPSSLETQWETQGAPAAGA
jgi:hypothetical protein